MGCIRQHNTEQVRQTCICIGQTRLTESYDNSESERINKIVTALGLKVRPQELKSKDHRQLLTAVLSQWLPLAAATFRAIVEVIPTPAAAQAVRIPKMLHPDLPYNQTTIKPETKLEEDLYSGASGADSFVTAYVSKMFAVPSSALPQNQRKPLTAEEMRERGRISREAAAALAASGAVVTDQGKALENAKAQENGHATPDEPSASGKSEEIEDKEEEALLGFARLYSGTLRAGQCLHALLPKYNTRLAPNHPRNAKFIMPIKVEYLYMMMGRELVMVDEVPAGNVCAIAGLEGKILRNGTLCGRSGTEALESLDALQEKDSLVNLAGLHSTVSDCLASELR